MNIESIRYFVTLAHARSFSAAARLLFISPQGLNKSVTALENELGTKLVTRSRQGVQLTAQGRALLPHAQSIVAEICAAVDDIALVDAQAQEDAPHLTITASEYAMSILAGLQATGTGILANAQVNEEPVAKIMELAKEGKTAELYLLELRHGLIEKLAEDEGLAFELVLSTHTGVIWREGFPLSSQPSISRAALVHTPLAFNSNKDLSDYVNWLFRETPLQNVQLRTSAVRLLIEFAHKNAVSLYDSFGYRISMADRDIPTEGLHFTPLSTPQARVDIGFIYRRDAHPNARCRRFIELAKKVFSTTYSESSSL